MSLWLVANHPATRPHSPLDHGELSAASKIAGREPVRPHPRDAGPLGLGDGDVVRIHGAVGGCLAGVRISDPVRPGVAQLATGAWWDPSAPEAATCVHGSPNAVTRDIGTSRLTQGRTGQLTRVALELHARPPAPVRAHG
ncbi:hypothetical protein JBE04_31585 [Streptomyces sp. PRKS01-29]|nr:molybdopterin dinucleotide binding domain-containing protein [Streptomyces sabulosicollis]MBI0298877.1 hypothetical protein [Streptomyces sabulosicollis]